MKGCKKGDIYDYSDDTDVLQFTDNVLFFLNIEHLHRQFLK